MRTDAGKSPRMSETSSVTSGGSGAADTADMSSVQEAEAVPAGGEE